MDSATYIVGVLRILGVYKDLAERAIAQVTDAELFRTPGGDVNPIAVTMKHMAGNMRSRWTDFLTSDGEKPDRDRDSEFEIHGTDTKAALLARWETGWQVARDAIAPLGDGDLDRTVHIRGRSYTVLHAIQRQLTHYAYHVGQIVHQAKALAGDRWTSLSVPRGESERHNERRRDA